MRKVSRLGRVGFVATDAEYRRIELLGSYRCRIIGMLGQGAMARLTIHVGVLAVLFLFENVRVTTLAGLMTGVIDRPGSDFRQGIAAIVSVLPETLGDEETSDNQEQDQAGQKDTCHPEQMPRILEDIHVARTRSRLTL